MPDFIDNSGSHIGMQVNATRVYFGGKEPSDLECAQLKASIQENFVAALEQGSLADVESMLDEALRRLLGGRGEWTELPECHIASITVDAKTLEDLYLPLGVLRRPPPARAVPTILRCMVEGTETIPEAPNPRPEGGRLLLAMSDAGGPIPEDAVVAAVRHACVAGLLPFDEKHDLLRSATRRSLHNALGGSDPRSGTVALILVTRMHNNGLWLDDGKRTVVVRPEDFAATLEPFAAHLRLVVLLPVDDGAPSGADLGRVIVDAAAAVHCRGVAAVVAPRVPLPEVAVADVVATLMGSLLGDARTPPCSLEGAIAAVGHVLRPHDGLARLGLRLYARDEDGDDTRPFVIRPYRGLLSFDGDNARFYFGREAEVQQIVQRLAELEQQNKARFLLLVGASGVGKSSLAKAGVVPALLDSDRSYIPLVTRPAEQSMGQLQELVARCRRGRRLVVIDELEELFSGDRREAEAYLQGLWTLATASEGTVVVATLRVDALNVGGEVKVDVAGGRSLEMLAQSRHAVFINHLQAEQLKLAICEPARIVGLEFDPGLAERLCEEALGEPGALPMLEMALDRQWAVRQGRRLVAFQGGLVGTVAAHANACLSALPDAQREQAKWTLVRIATGSDGDGAMPRRWSTVDVLRPAQENRRVAFDAAKDALVAGRLVVTGHHHGVGSKGETTIELAHDMLRRQWPDLRDWIREDAPRLVAMRDLERWVDEWGKWGTLLPENRLRYIVQSKIDPGDLNQEMNDLINASRRATRQKTVLWIVAAVLGSAVLVTVIVNQQVRADIDRAKRELVVAEAKASAASQEANAIKEDKEYQRQLHGREVAGLEDRIARSKQLQDRLVEVVNALFKTVRSAPDGRCASPAVLEGLFRQMESEVEDLSSSGVGVDMRWIDVAAHRRRGRELVTIGAVDAAREELRAALALAESEAKERPYDVQVRRDLSLSLELLGSLEMNAGNLPSARELLEKNLKIIEGLRVEGSNDSRARDELSSALQLLGNLETMAKEFARAIKWFERDVELREEALRVEAPGGQPRRDYYHALKRLAFAQQAAMRRAEARRTFEDALGVTEALMIADPADEEASFEAVLCHKAIITLLDGGGEADMVALQSHIQRSIERLDMLRRPTNSGVSSREYEAVRAFIMAKHAAIE